tara:strand:+ start:4744 stop:10164 length:5421 start_codon:yes stop_codon:yes gene_type:complete
MAEKRFIKGLFKDTAHLDQPQATWRHARNMLLNSTDGAVSNEGGTELSGHLGTNTTNGAQNDKVIGAIEVNDDKVVLFIVDVVSPTPRSEIGIWEDGSYTILYNPTPTITVDLNFRESNPIEGTFKIDSKGDLVVYWTDDLNPPRAFNVDRQLRDSTGISNLYGIPSLNSINLLNLFPYSGSVPHIYVADMGTFQDVVKEGGGLLTAVYYLALAYVDDDFVATNYLTVSNPVSIVDEFDHTRPTTKKDGAKAGSQTSKSLKWRVSNLNVNYKYVRPIVIRKMGDATEVFKLNDLEINLNTDPTPFQEITFSGAEGFTSGSVEDVMIDTTSYETAKTINQLDGVLYLGNLSGSKDIGYQKYANNIKSRSFVKTIEDFDEIWATADGLQSGFGQSLVDEGNTVGHEKSYRYIPNTINYRGYMRDEVYAFYLAFIMNDGSMSYAYHIPGRESISSDYDGYDLATGIRNEEDSVPGSTVASVALAELSSDASLFHFYDRSWVNTGANSHSSGSRHMQFWKNSGESYPNTENFEIWDGSSGYTGDDLKELKVRHHKMPSNANASRTTVESSFETEILDSTADPTPVLPGTYTGTFRVGLHVDTNGYSCIASAQGNQFLPDSWTALDLDVMIDDTMANGVSAASTCYNSNVFTAQEDNCYVKVTSHVQFFNDHKCNSHTGNIQVQVTGGASSPSWSESIGAARCSGCLSGVNGTSYAFDPDRTVNGTWTVGPLLQGEQIKVYGWGYVKSSGEKVMTPLCHDKVQGLGNLVVGIPTLGSFVTNSYVSYTVYYAGNEDYHDANIKHDVNILGMHFDDIKIPASYKEKIQGFRIYRAKRKYSNKTVLGQGPILPMKNLTGTLGLCKESLDPSQVQWSSQVIQGEGREAETFLACEAWKATAGSYASYSGPSSQYNVNEKAYKTMQFYDFNLLRTKSSLAPTTHIQVQYRTNDLVWNGPEINQPKKMLTVLSGGGVTTPYSSKEVWGYDNDGTSGTNGKFQNCYQRPVNSAMFVGGKYHRAYSTFGSMGTWNINRVLGQKAKAYLQGDSIFNATSLGFGGKIVNLGGNSSVVFSMANKLELPAVTSRDLNGNLDEQFGVWRPGFGFNLVTRSESDVDGNGTGINSTPRHQNYIINLNAFKTDVYKNIDNQELVWTGWQIEGSDLDNFLFDDDSVFTPTTSPTYTTESIEPEGADTPGVFGGDTFIARYGVAEAYAPSDSETDSTPSASIMSYIVESPDNIALRHAESDDSLYYPGSIAKDVLSVSGRGSDLNHVDNLKYNDNYSAVNDIRPAFPLPLRDIIQTEFPTRTHRSAKNDTTSLIDNYRIFLANQFKDLPKNRGDLWKLSSFNNLLYFHMEESLYAAKGKQSMTMKDGSEAFVGSGDIFQQDPDEVIQTEGGFGGTQSQYAALTTRYGYFFVDQLSRKVFLMKDKLSEISGLGMEGWFRDNMETDLAEYDFSASCNIDNPVLGLGFHSIYDPKYKRIILTKRDLQVTEAFLTGWNIPNAIPYQAGTIRFSQDECKYRIFFPGLSLPAPAPPNPGTWTNLEWDDETYFKKTGWTISYYPELNVWGSFHDYTPYIYFNTSLDFYSLTDKYPRPCVGIVDGTLMGNAGIYKHDSGRKGILYQQFSGTYDNLGILEYHPFEFEFIHNETKGMDTLLSSFNYTSEVFNSAGVNVLEHGFTKFLLYNTFQLSGESDLEYLVNTRRVGNNWKVNRFRDMSLDAVNASPYYMQGTVTNPNIIGGTNVGTITTSTTQSMFEYDGMSKNVNAGYLDLAKTWDRQRKFIDKWVGIRLIYDNISNNLLNLYSTNVVVRKMYR